MVFTLLVVDVDGEHVGVNDAQLRGDKIGDLLVGLALADLIAKPREGPVLPRQILFVPISPKSH